MVLVDSLLLCTGRRDDLWSWLYVLVEMLDGGLCWRVGKDKADRQAEDATRHQNGKHMDAEKQKKKEVALKKKRAALAEPELLTANVEVPGLYTHSAVTCICAALHCVGMHGDASQS